MVLTLSQMGRTRRSLRDSQHNSPDDTDDEDLRSPISERGDPVSPVVSRGRKGKSGGGDADTIRVRKGDGDAMDVMH